MTLRVTVQDTNIVTVTPLAAGSVATQIFTVTGLKVGNTAVHIAYSGTSALCPNPGALDLTVHVIEPPAIVQQPAGQSIAVGADVTFTVVATGNLLRYQWRLNGVNLPGATSDTLAITGVQPSDAGDYSVVVYNPAGVIKSADAGLSVTNILSLPFADNFAGPNNTITGPVGVGRGSNIGATREPGEPLHAGERGTNSVWLTWTAPASGVATFSTAGSDFDTLLAVYAGTVVTNLTEVASDNDSGGFLTSQLKFYATQGADYHIAVDGFHGAQGEIVFDWNLVPSTTAIPKIITQPAAVSGPTNDNASLLVGFDSPGPALVQWFRDGQLVRQTNASGSDTLTIAGLKISDVGNYRVRITPASAPNDPLQEIFSKMFPVQIHLRGDGSVVRGVFAQDKLFDAIDALGVAQPAGLAKSSRLGKHSGGPATGYTGTQIFSTYGAAKEPGEPDPCGEPGGASEWYTYQPPANGILKMNTDGSGFDTVIGIYTIPDGEPASYENLHSEACDNDSGANGRTSAVTFTAVSNRIYYVVVDGVGGASGTVRLNYGLGVPPVITQQPAGRTVAAGGNVTLNVAATGTPGPFFQWQLNQMNLAGATNASLNIASFQSVNEGDYTVLVNNFAGAVTSAPAILLLDSPLRLESLGIGANGVFQLRLSGQSSTNYVLQASTNLTNWLSLATNSAPNGLWEFVDTNSSNLSRRFYRAMPGP